MIQNSVNRYIELSEIMDNIDHALGRPVDPLGETYRNHFECASVDEAISLEQTGYWVRKGCICSVNRAGRAALKRYLIDTENEVIT